MAGVMISDRFSTHTSAPVSFLPNDVPIACWAILPQCFRRFDWVYLCAREPRVAHGILRLVGLLDSNKVNLITVWVGDA